MTPRAIWVHCAVCDRRLPDTYTCPHHDRTLCSACCGCDPDLGPADDLGPDEDNDELARERCGMFLTVDHLEGNAA